MNGTYYRWTELPDLVLRADLLMSDLKVDADPTNEYVVLTCKDPATILSPDEARLIGVRLIEAAALAAGRSCVREA